MTSARRTCKRFPLLSNHRGFSLIEIMVALLLAALVFVAIPSGDNVQRHRDLKRAVSDLDRTAKFAANEAILRNSVVRLRIQLDKSPIEYTVEYGPAGNLPLPDMPEKSSMSIAEAKERQKVGADLDRQFNKVPEFEEIKQEMPLEVTLLGVASTSTKKLIQNESANIYFYPTGEKDGALLFFSTVEEMAYLEIEPFLSETNTEFIPLDPASVAKLEDVLQTKMDEVYGQWINK